MSKIALSPHASGTGVFTIQSPNSNTDRTLVLPDEAGTVLTSASSLAAANLTGALPALDGSALTNLSAGPEMFWHRGNPGSTSTGNYIDSGLYFTPSVDSDLIIGWQYNYRHSTSQYAYFLPRLLASNGSTVIETVGEYGGNYASSSASHAQGVGGVMAAIGTTLTGGTTYNIRIRFEGGASINPSSDAGYDLHIVAWCYPA